MISFWTEEKVAALRKLCAESLSASQIGDALSCTRNAVIGRAHRNGIQLRGRPKARDRTPPRDSNGVAYASKKDRVRAFVKPRKNGTAMQIIAQDLPPPLVEDAPTEPKALFDLRNGDCRWPLGGDYEPAKLFCAASAVDGHPYCGAHCRIAYHNFAHRRAA